MASVVGLLLAICLRQAPATAPTTPATPLPQIDALLGQLSDPRYEIREEATQNLCALGEGDLPLLYKRYRAESRYEIKRRLRYIIESVFHRGQLMGRDGFMGIQIYRQMLGDLTDPQSKKTTRGVIIRDVKPGFAAERAGLEGNDIIIALDNEPVPEDPTQASTAFVERVASRHPGTTISLRILRPQKFQRIQIKGGPDSAKMLSSVHLVAASDISTSTIFFISSIDEPSAATQAGFRPNQIIRSFNGYPLSGNSLEALVKGVPSQNEITLEIADTELKTIPVRLGRRPPEYAEAKDHLEAQTRFIRWWQEQGGDTPPRFGPNLMPHMVWNAMAPRRVGPETTLQP